MLTKYGKDNIIVLLTISLILILTGIGKGKYLTFTLAGVIIFIITMVFFRDPKRNVPEEALKDSSIIISPADGKVSQIETVYEEYFLKKECIRISIFLSPLDVHVNRVPSGGEVVFIDYKPGRFFAAYDHRASDKNEQSIIGIKNNSNTYVFKQIVGVLARRVIYELKVGDSVSTGQKFGMMRFGSRMDIFLEPGSEIHVELGQRVVGGETKIAKMISK